MQSQISFKPDRNFHAMKILSLYRHAPRYLRHVHAKFGEKNDSRRNVLTPQITWVEKIMGYFNFHGSENILEMILPLHTRLEVLY